MMLVMHPDPRVAAALERCAELDIQVEIPPGYEDRVTVNDAGDLVLTFPNPPTVSEGRDVIAPDGSRHFIVTKVDDELVPWRCQEHGTECRLLRS